MSAPVWSPGTLYLPGDLVQPLTAPAVSSTTISNATFQTGDATDWTLDAGVTVEAGGYGGSGYNLKFSGGAGVDKIAIHAAVPVTPGTTITAACMYGQGAAGAGNNAGAVFLRWLDALNAQVGSDAIGTRVTSSSGSGWKQSTVTATAPTGATQVQIGCTVHRTAVPASYADAFTWNYAVSALPAGLIYKAVQAAPGHSAASEPTWPTVLGVQVVDNEVTWEAVATSRVTWTASPLFVSGTVEPTWPTEPGERIVDGTIAWECVTRRVTDAHCPNSTVVAIIAAKVLAVDGDIVRHSAAANPLDWTTARNAGFLATGLQQANASDFAVLAPYRNNLACFNAHCFQHWQMDPDPELCAQLDQLDGVGSLWPRAAVAVSNELFYLTAVGVRSIGIAVGAQNLQAGDVGEPVDDLVQAALALEQGSPLATYYPGLGQYWLAFPDVPAPTVSISGDLPDGVLGDPVSYAYDVDNGTAPFVFALTAGALPAGLTLNTSTGVVSGTRSATGTATWTVQVTDALGDTDSVDDASTTVDGAVSLTSLETLVTVSGGTVLAWDPSSTYLAITGYDAPHVFVYKRTGDSFAALTLPSLGMSSRGQGLDWAPDGSELAVAPEASVLPFVLARDGDSFTQHVLDDLAPGAQERGLVYRPDGGQLVLAAETALAGWAIEGGLHAALGDLATLAATSNAMQASAFSADGALLVTGLAASPYLDLQAVDGDDYTGLTVPAALPAPAFMPRFSPGDLYLGWAQGTSPYYTVCQRTPGTDTFTPLGGLPASPAAGQCFAWSPNGANFGLGATGHDARLYKRNGTTISLALAPSGTTNTTAIAWSPDGQYLAISHGGGTTLYKVT